MPLLANNLRPTGSNRKCGSAKRSGVATGCVYVLKPSDIHTAPPSEYVPPLFPARVFTRQRDFKLYLMSLQLDAEFRDNSIKPTY